MAKQNIQTNISDADRKLCGKYTDKDGKHYMVIASRNTHGKEYLDIAEVVGFAKTPLFEEIKADELMKKIHDKTLNRL